LLHNKDSSSINRSSTSSVNISSIRSRSFRDLPLRYKLRNS